MIFSRARAAQLVAAPLEARDDLAAEPAADAVRLDEHECGLDGHRRAGVYGALVEAEQPTRSA